MTDIKQVKVENRLIAEKRAINVYHHVTRGAYLISHGGSVILPLQTGGQKDYLHLTLTSGPGPMEKECQLEFPWWLDYEILSEGRVLLSHQGESVLVNFPPSHLLWQLKTAIPHRMPLAVPIGETDLRIVIREL